MKLSVSLPEADVQFLDSYIRSRAGGSRSAALHDAVKALQGQSLAGAYADAWDEWRQADDGDLWETTVADGL